MPFRDICEFEKNSFIDATGYHNSIVNNTIELNAGFLGRSIRVLDRFFFSYKSFFNTASELSKRFTILILYLFVFTRRGRGSVRSGEEKNYRRAHLPSPRLTH